MSAPLVSVICMCYNHARFVNQAIESVLQQTYTPVQLVVVDDGSTDNSVNVIQRLVAQHPSIEFLPLTHNHGYCSALNLGLAKTKGEYIIDLAADDVLLPNRIEVGMKKLQEAGPAYGVHFSDAMLVDEEGRFLANHSDRFPHSTIPQGDIYKDLISRYFICSPTMMFTRAVANDLNGFDEKLTYEDFDFWIRSSRKFRYVYSPEVLIKRRITAGAMTSRQFRLFSPDSLSTFRVCEKIMRLNRTREEQQALNKRIFYEIILNARLLNLLIVLRYCKLWLVNQGQKYE